MLIQGAFANDWIMARAAKEKVAVENHKSSNATKASVGHAAGAASTMKALDKKNAHEQNLFKMPRFRDISSKVQMPKIQAVICRA